MLHCVLYDFINNTKYNYMPANLSFTHQLPINGAKAKRAFFGCLIFVCLCVIGYILSQVFWDQFVYTAYSFKHKGNVQKGWPVTLQNLSVFMGIGTLVFAPFIYFMQDWKNPSLAITAQGLFINQQMMRNTVIPFSNIEKVEKTAEGYRLSFKDQGAILQQLGFFKAFVKYNLENNRFFISDTHTAGDLDAFFVELKKHL